MRAWMRALRQDPEYLADFEQFLDEAVSQAMQHFMNAKDFDGVAKVQGRIEAMQQLKYIISLPDKEALDAAERYQRGQRALTGTALGPDPSHY